jgi:hypothetical protein
MRRAHIGETATVCGVVTSAEYETDVQQQPTLLDLGKPSPNAVFTAVIYGDNRQKFGTPETSLRGKRICVTGQISDYQGKPENRPYRSEPVVGVGSAARLMEFAFGAMVVRSPSVRQCPSDAALAI